MNQRTKYRHSIHSRGHLRSVLSLIASISLTAWAGWSAESVTAVLDLSRLPAAATHPVDFAREVQPLLVRHCSQCHGPEKQKGGLRLDVRAAAFKGGDSGPAIVPGRGAESRLVQLVSGLDPKAVMPPKGEHLTSKEVALLRAWIDQGSHWPEDAGAKPARSAHWSLQPLRSVVELETALWSGFANVSQRWSEWRSAITNPIDAYVLIRLATNGLGISPPADRATLLRRLSFDLVGLPPTPAEIDAFVADRSVGAAARVVERLLTSPHYGERWGRHWLDVARYTESQGFEYDRLRDNAWHYRDYVIRSFNEDKPYDQFVREQVAGDVLEPVTSDGIIGTSLLVCGPWDEAGNAQANATQKAITREEELEDMISTVGQTFLGLTLNCARCHSHKFDPISIEEYYRVKAVFDGVKHGERSVAGPEEVRAREARVAALKQEITRARDEAAQLETKGWKTAAAEERALTPEEIEIGFRVGEYSRPQSVGLLFLNADQRAQREAALAARASAERALGAVQPVPISYVGTRVQPAPTRVLRRGDVKSAADIIAPAAISAIVDLDADLKLPVDAPEAERRRRFAHWLTDPRNPLPARVMANRVWQFHFGQGLVATPNDFGASGARPTHPELLDWLAARLIDSGWSVKALHRLIVSSRVYQQASSLAGKADVASGQQVDGDTRTKLGADSSSGRTTDGWLLGPADRERAIRLDADNQHLWRYPARRLEAEAVRDAALAVSGQLNPQMGGPSFRPFDSLKFPANAYQPVDKIGPEFNRRTVYRMNVNSGKEPLLDVFDCPDPSVRTPRRGMTTTPLQALALMNNSFVQRQAGALADRALREADRDLPRAIGTAYRLSLGRGPTEDEMDRALAAARARSLTNVCWVLLNSTEFVYVQ